MAIKMGILYTVTNTTRVMVSEAEAYLAVHVQEHVSGEEFPLLLTMDELYVKSNQITLHAEFVNEMVAGHVYVLDIHTRKGKRHMHLIQLSGLSGKTTKVVVALPERVYSRAKARAVAKAAIVPKKTFFGNLVD